MRGVKKAFDSDGSLDVDKYLTEVKDRNPRMNVAMDRVIMSSTWFLIKFTTSGATASTINNTQQAFSRDDDGLTMATHQDNINTSSTSSNTIPTIISNVSPTELFVILLMLVCFAIAIVLIPPVMSIRTFFIHKCKRNRKGTLDIPSQERTRDILRIPHVSDAEPEEGTGMVPRNTEEPSTASADSHTYSEKIYRSGIRSVPYILELGGCTLEEEGEHSARESLYETIDDEIPSENHQKRMLQPTREHTTPTCSSDMAKRPLPKIDLSMRPLPKINEDQNELNNYDTPSSRNVNSVDIHTKPTLTQETAGLFNPRTFTYDFEDDKFGEYIDMSQRVVDQLPLAENMETSKAVSAETPEMNSTILAERGTVGPSSTEECSNNWVSTTGATGDVPYQLSSRYIGNIEHPIFNLTPSAYIYSLIKGNSYG